MAAPTISSTSPPRGPAGGGTSFSVYGTGFVNGATIKLGGTLATSVIWISATHLVGVTPAHSVGSADVLITNPDTLTATIVGGFTYFSDPIGDTPSAWRLHRFDMKPRAEERA